MLQLVLTPTPRVPRSLVDHLQHHLRRGAFRDLPTWSTTGSGDFAHALGMRNWLPFPKVPFEAALDNRASGYSLILRTLYDIPSWWRRFVNIRC